MSNKLGDAKDRDGIRAIVESLVQTANEMQKHNNNLEARLNASRRKSASYNRISRSSATRA